MRAIEGRLQCKSGRVYTVMLSRRDGTYNILCPLDLRCAGNAAGLDPRITAVLPNADNGGFGAKVGSHSCWHPVICLRHLCHHDVTLNWTLTLLLSRNIGQMKVLSQSLWPHMRCPHLQA